MAKATTISMSSTHALPRLMLALTQLAIFRGAKMDKTLLTLYSKRLAQENPDDVCVALKKLEEVPRKEGETALPDIGTILAAVELERRARVVRMTSLDEERLVRWRCPECNVTCCGFVKYGESRLRYCRGIPRRKNYRPGEVCGATLDVIEDLPASVVRDSAENLAEKENTDYFSS